MGRQAPATRPRLSLVEKKSVSPADLSDVESQRVLTVAAHAVAGELGRQAAREFFMHFGGTHREP